MSALVLALLTALTPPAICNRIISSPSEDLKGADSCSGIGDNVEESRKTDDAVSLFVYVQGIKYRRSGR